MNHKHLYIIIIVVIVGIIAYVIINNYLKSDIDKEWSYYQEDGSHKIIMEFQDSLNHITDPIEIERVVKKIDAQLKLEELIFKSTEARNSKVTVFSGIITGGVALLSGIVGAFISKMEKKKT